jgi:hypothetical protein
MPSHPVKLSGLTYQQLSLKLSVEPSERLVALLNERSIKIGDTAADILSTRGETFMVVDAMMSGRLSTRNGKVRALNLLSQRALPDAVPVYLRMILDPNPDVVSSALFGLVFWNDARHLPAIRAIKNSSARQIQEQAISALEAGNPQLYSPHFYDAAGVWKSDTKI